VLDVGIMFPDFFDARVVLLARKPGDLAGYGGLCAPSIINRDEVAELIEPLMYGIPEIAAMVVDIDSAFRDAREPGHMPLSRLAVDPHTLDDDGSPSDILEQIPRIFPVSARHSGASP
jgi:hypothetical protein